MEFLRQITAPNVKLNQLKVGQEYYLVTETQRGVRKTLVKYLFAEDGFMTFEFWHRFRSEFLRVNAAHYNLTDSPSSYTGCLFSSLSEADDYYDYLLMHKRSKQLTINRNEGNNECV